jgi:hypothetical protein
MLTMQWKEYICISLFWSLIFNNMSGNNIFELYIYTTNIMLNYFTGHVYRQHTQCPELNFTFDQSK